MPTMQDNYLVISALGKDQPGIVNELSALILEGGCNIEDSRMAALGEEFAMIVLVSGKWNSIAKLESSLPHLEKRLDLSITTRRTAPRKSNANMLPYAVDVIAMDHPGIVNHLASFLSKRRINIEDMTTNRYAAAHTGTPMFSVHIHISVPGEIHIASLRDEFLNFCDEMNLDAVMEPIKA